MCKNDHKLILYELNEFIKKEIYKIQNYSIKSDIGSLRKTIDKVSFDILKEDIEMLRNTLYSKVI